MAEEIKKVELSEDDLDLVAGGAIVDGQPFSYRCGYCGCVATYNSKDEARAHVRACPNNPNNR